MNKLVQVIETTRVKIEALRKHALKETPTRIIVIDPLLEALGWDVRDPDEVELEFPTVDGKSVDYGLKLNRMTNTLVTVRLDRHGFRGPDRGPEKAPGVHRTMMLGDSFTAGLHVAEEDSFPARLEASLNSKSAQGARFEVINAGVPGYSTAQELELFRDFGWQQGYGDRIFRVAELLNFVWDYSRLVAPLPGIG